MDGERKTEDFSVDPRFTAAVDLLRRTGARSFQIRWQDDEEPMVWIAVSEWVVNEDGMPTPDDDGEPHYDVAAGLSPLSAVFRLCEQTIDGGLCVHCHRPAAFIPDLDPHPLLADVVCRQQWDPELRTFRRDCEADHENRR